MFIGIILVSAGSSYYHLSPSNGPLVWDRLPMSIAFTAMTVAVVTEYVSPNFERYALLPVIVTGASSVIVWHYTGDLRFYFWVQVVSVLTVLLTIYFFRHENRHAKYIVGAGLLYGLAVIAEQFDRQIFAIFSGAISGHTLKHLIAACALLMFVLRLRKPMPTGT